MYLPDTIYIKIAESCLIAMYFHGDKVVDNKVPHRQATTVLYYY